MNIRSNAQRILNELPQGIELIAAAKSKSPQDIQEAVDAGIKIIGENYLQEAQEAFSAIGNKVKWHFIGHLQKNKVKKAVDLFDTIETVDSFKLAELIDKECSKANKIMSILIEVNSGKEQQKFGILPKDAVAFTKGLTQLNNIRIMGLMTMAPYSNNPEDARPYFKETKKLFGQIKALDLPNVQMKYLSMGMSDSYKVAIQEGANMVRIGAGIFGQREG